MPKSPHAVQRFLKPPTNVKNVVAVASGKGVGKSTTAANLALAWAAQGAKGWAAGRRLYSAALMMGLAGAKPVSTDGKHIAAPGARRGSYVRGFMIDRTADGLARADGDFG